MYSEELEPHVEKLLKQRYYKANENWPVLVERVVNHVYQLDNKEKDTAKQLLLDRVFLPNSPCLVNAGTKTGGLAACFTIGPREDSLESHMTAFADIAMVAKRGGGCGFTGTFFRPENSPVAGSAHGYAYGPNAWAIQVNNFLDIMTQGGFRKMALMYTMRDDHPDLEKFINLKQTKDELYGSGFNQSVMATDKWLEIATNDKRSEPYRLLNQLVENNWKNGEPGILFHTTINENTPYKTCGCDIEVANVCGELPMPDYATCNLGSINLSHKLFLSEKGFNYKELRKVVGVLVRFLDNVGSVNVFPNDKFSKWYDGHRPIGLGIMGVADLFLNYQISYGSNKSIDFLDKILKVIYEEAKAVSENLGKEKGIPNHCKTLSRRNITLLTIAPTGSIAFIANCSHGIEPIFSPTYHRTDERGEVYTFEHNLADKLYFRSAINKNVNKTPTWQEQIKIQAICQKWIDSAISKTINLPNDATKETIYDIFVAAWKNKLKGITVYRDGSREVQVLNTTKKETKKQQIIKNDAPKRPKELPCKINNTVVKGNQWVVLVGFLNNDPYEVFAFRNGKLKHKEGKLIKKGNGKYNLVCDSDLIIEDISGTHMTDAEQALTRMISLSLRHGAELKYVFQQLNRSHGTVVDFSKAIMRTLKKFVGEITIKEKCPECDSSLKYESGCKSCSNNCGYSACG